MGQLEQPADEVTDDIPQRGPTRAGDVYRSLFEEGLELDVRERLRDELVDGFVCLGASDVLQAIRELPSALLNPKLLRPRAEHVEVLPQRRVPVDLLVRDSMDQFMCEGVYNTRTKNRVALHVVQLECFVVQLYHGLTVRAVVVLAQLLEVELAFPPIPDSDTVEVVAGEAAQQAVVEAALGDLAQESLDHLVGIHRPAIHDDVTNKGGGCPVVGIVLCRLRRFLEQLDRLVVEERSQLVGHRLILPGFPYLGQHVLRDGDPAQLVDVFLRLGLRHLPRLQAGGYEPVPFRLTVRQDDLAHVRRDIPPDTELLQAANEPCLLTVVTVQGGVRFDLPLERLDHTVDCINGEQAKTLDSGDGVRGLAAFLPRFEVGDGLGDLLVLLHRHLFGEVFFRRGGLAFLCL